MERLAIPDLNSQYGSTWRDPVDEARYRVWSGIVKEYVRLVLKEGNSEEQAPHSLEELQRGGGGVYWRYILGLNN